MENILKRIYELPFLKDVDSSIVARLRKQIESGERLDEDSKQLILDNPHVVLDDDRYQVIRNSSIEFWVYDKNSPLARFFNQGDSVEYIMYKLNLL